ncbi:MAG TPA: orotidine-5'-phosphate decarboxylase [Candidatus Acidoferrales bacterium]|nr:orotidine-5'-phosphate decarboxylase [Candidatus Acidoferrales bacterium]
MVALDVEQLRPALSLARQLRGAAGLLKVGSQLFTGEGPRAVKRLAGLGFEIFLDLKFHDIPNTVAGAVASAAELPNIKMLTLHAAGGIEMMRAARNAIAARKTRPALLGITILTSLNATALRQIGLAGLPASRAVALARLAKVAGLDGVVASAHEVRAIRRACGPGFLIVVPGVRPANSSTNDQARVATPSEAVRAGADYLVIGRPITAAPNPRKAALAIGEEISSVVRRGR